MFDHLTERLSAAFGKLTGGVVLNATHVDEALKEIRRSLLDADVHFKVARDVCDRVKSRAVGAEVWKNLTAGQQVVQIFNEELVEALGGKEQSPPEFAGKPPIIVLVAGLQGSGKTTFSAKLALHIRKKLHKTVGLLPCDCARPAAKEQLTALAKRVGIEAFDSPIQKGAVTVAREGLKWAQSQFFDVLVVDTAGRQQIDEELMRELSEIERVLAPQERFLVLDAMIGSQGLEVARAFHEHARLTGLVLAKMDGDARGGIALSARAVTGVPIVFAGVGEKPEDFEPFHPSRMASRILGMGDVLSLVEKAREAISDDEAIDSAQKMFGGRFTLEDFRDQLKRLQNMGPLEGIMKLIPGMGQMMGSLKGVDPEREMKKVEAIINSMTAAERKKPDVLNGSRRLRISKGSGTQVSDINRFLKQFMEMRKMMKQFSKMGMGSRIKKLAQAAQSGKKPLL